MEELFLFSLCINRCDRTKLHDWLDYNCPSWSYSVDPNRTGLCQRLPKDPAVRDPFYAVLKKTQEIALDHPDKSLKARCRILVNKHDATILQMFHDVALVTWRPRQVNADRLTPMVFE